MEKCLQSVNNTHVSGFVTLKMSMSLLESVINIIQIKSINLKPTKHLKKTGKSNNNTNTNTTNKTILSHLDWETT